MKGESMDKNGRLVDLQQLSRRHFLMESAAGLGVAALGAMLGAGCSAKDHNRIQKVVDAMAPKPPHFPAKAKRVIYLHMAGAPSQLELFDYKPELAKLNNKLCPPSLLEGKRFAFIRGVPKMLGPPGGIPAARTIGRLCVRPPSSLCHRCRRGVIFEGGAYRPVRSCAGAALCPYGRSPTWKAEHGFLDNVRAGLREQQPARLRGADIGRENAGRRKKCLGQRLPAFGLSGSTMPVRWRACTILN